MSHLQEIDGITGEILGGKNSESKGVYLAPEATRFEVHGAPGESVRIFTLDPGASIHIQDNGKTVKIFTGEQVESSAWLAKTQREKEHSLLW